MHDSSDVEHDVLRVDFRLRHAGVFRLHPRAERVRGRIEAREVEGWKPIL